MLWSFDKPAEEWASRSPAWKQSQSLYLRKTLLITFWRWFVTERPHCKVKSHVCTESSAKEFPSGYKTGQRIPGSPSLQRKLSLSPQMHTKKITFLPHFSISGTSFCLQGASATIFRVLIFPPYPQDSWSWGTHQPSLHLSPAWDDLDCSQTHFLRATLW